MGEGSDSESITSGKAPSMSPGEKEILLDLINEYKGIIESKKTDFGTTDKKTKAWKNISERFCSAPGTVRRTEIQLKSWWANTKKRVKKRVAKNNRSFKKTGGGEAEDKDDKEMERVSSIIPSQMTSLPNEFDDDAPSDQEFHTPAFMDEEGSILENNETSGIIDETSAQLLPPPAKKSKFVEKEKTARKQKDARSALVDMEYEEHRLRMKILATELETANIIKQKADNEKQNCKEYHDLKVKLLKIQIDQALSFAVVVNNGE